MAKPLMPSRLKGDVFHPSEEVSTQARLKDWDALARTSLADPLAFWESEAQELEWFGKWTKVLDESGRPFFKWFVGGKVNIVHNAIDRHLHTYRKNKLALIWESEDGKQHQTFSYYAMNREVSRMANIIKAMEVAKEMRMKTVALTGNDGGILTKISDISLIVPSTSTPRIQETHILIGHILCEMVEHQLFIK